MRYGWMPTEGRAEGIEIVDDSPLHAGVEIVGGRVGQRNVASLSMCDRYHVPVWRE